MSSIFERDRPVPPEWQADLESVVPRSDTVPWLKIVFQAGWEYEPIQRFEIYEMTRQLDWVPEGTVDALRGPNPRTMGMWLEDTSITGHRRWISDSIVSLMQWNLYRETGCYGQRWWILQGAHGGHKWRLSPVERAYLAATRGLSADEADTPAPGSLPYAPWDERSKLAIIRADRLRTWKQAMGWAGRSEQKTEAGVLVQADRAKLKQMYSELILKWLDEQVYEALSMVSQKALDQVRDAPLGDPQFNREQDEIERELIKG